MNIFIYLGEKSNDNLIDLIYLLYEETDRLNKIVAQR